MRCVAYLIGLLLLPGAWAMSASEYLPKDMDPDPAIPTPEDVLGWTIGDSSISHDQLLHYMSALAEASERAQLKVIGHTHEGRKLVQLIFTSPDNQEQLEAMRVQHIEAAGNPNKPDGPLVVWLGHSIHGNEASGSNAAPLVAYYLAASRSNFVTELLDAGIIILDPSFNPDGLQRFSSWSNANRILHPVAHREHRIHNEEWPQSRTNHYLFDLNRDWLPLVHPESRARVAEFHRWLPHVMTDQHEASSAVAYFFQPGVPERQNPLLPPETLEMHRLLGAYHAAAMEKSGVMYFTEDSYDDFYLGKGSTYTDISGTVGILFEQPRVNGPKVERSGVTLTFKNAISNQVNTSLSTLKGAHELRDRLATYQAGFFQLMRERADDFGFSAWIIGDDNDPARARAFLEILGQHDVRFETLAEDVELEGHNYRAGQAWVIPVRQRQFGLLQGLFERRTEFRDNTFYDVSAWTLPDAYNLPHGQLRRIPRTADPGPTQPQPLDENAVAWLVPWNQMQAPALLQSLLTAGARVRVAIEAFSSNNLAGPEDFSPGTLQIHAAIQDPNRIGDIRQLLGEATRTGVRVVSAQSGLTPSGSDLGGPGFDFLEPIRPVLLVGQGTSAYHVGEIWHHMDQRLGFAPLMVGIDRLDRLRLSDHTHLIMSDASHRELNKKMKAGIGEWVRAGGTLITHGRSVNWTENSCFASGQRNCDPGTEAVNTEPADTPGRAYAEYESDRVRGLVGGAIVAAELDLTHPLAYGYQRSKLPLFRRGTVRLETSDNPYAMPLRYADTPLIAGFMSPERQDDIRGQGALVAERRGQGLVIRFANNPLFRGFWRGTERLFDNSLYFSQLVESTQLPD